ncbi:hypothetical protein AKJ09_08638 [Labilithrix luteola]|uniref:Uncharacterized protein n=1 Tax=Labilithrix luteola TaxID=1391654 RepID=A0A0K1Q971_9BACT|nr:hypothetical protein AKJ09_08638 [Labilithrix luteola]
MTGDDYERLGDAAEAYVVFLGNEAFMRLEPIVSGLHCCAALRIDPVDGSFGCVVYERRPTVCRELERAGPACDGERWTKGERPKRTLAVLRTTS